jgi:hypothetical protein
MKDIDFDELDRAVSSVLETPADETPTTGATPVKVKATDETTDTPAVTVVDEEVAAEPEAAPAVTAPVVDRPKPALAVKRRGQFMDVVHPSSDMTGKPSDTPTAPNKKVSLQPIVTDSEQQSDTPEVPSEATETTPTVEVVEPSASDTLSIATEAPAAEGQSWPDPLDVMEAKETSTDAETAPVDVSAETPDAAVIEAPAEAVDEAAGATTPFLADTKVDKRPLDAFSGEEAVDDAEAAPAANVEPELTSPELQPDIIAVEASASDQTDSDDVAEEATDAAPSSQFNESIPQQYAATESQTDDEHSIFDTKEYHQPLSPAEKKKGGMPGWVKALLVVFVLAGLGAAGGYFWFYYGI